VVVITSSGYPPGYRSDPTLPPGWEYASPGPRLGAQVLDRILLWLCLIPAGLIFIGYAVAASAMGYGSGDQPPVPTIGALVGGGLSGLAALAGGAVWVYLVGWRTGTRGQSWGKKLVGIHVRTASGLAIPGGGTGIARLAVWWGMSALSCGLLGVLDDLWLLWDPRRQCLHDKVVSTVVVRVAMPPVGPGRATR
jgi:uncharacterized RDD family membrane protein YckC